MTIDQALRSLCLASARLPIFSGLPMRLLVFGRQRGEAEVVALVHKGPNAGTEATVRLHSACLTGDVFGSAKCDCGAQLQLAMNAISRVDFGVVLYFMHHEGRGIGILNKVRAYALQDEGLDTVEANRALGFEVDARDFSLAADILRELGATEVRLLTNNPEKVAAVERGGIRVIERVTLDAPLTEHNRDYLETKRRFFGHMPLRDPATGYLGPEAFARLFDGRLAGQAETVRDVLMITMTLHSYGSVHDALGLEAANAMLRTVTRRLSHTVRGSELLARVADDRLVLVLEDISEFAAHRVAARIRDALHGMTFAWKDRDHPVTVRIDVGLLPQGDSLAELLHGAERILPDDSVTQPASR
jgi:GTP cyclohydrolase II